MKPVLPRGTARILAYLFFVLALGRGFFGWSQILKNLSVSLEIEKARAATVASQIGYYTANNGVNFIRSLTPQNLSTASGSGTVSQAINPDGSVAIGVNNSPAYADSGFYINAGALGNLESISIQAASGSGPYGLNIWFDRDNNGDYFTWNASGTVYQGTGGDAYILGPDSGGGILLVNDSSTFDSLNPGGGNYTLAQLKNGIASGINGSTSIAIWVGVSVNSGSANATIQNININGTNPPSAPAPSVTAPTISGGGRSSAPAPSNAYFSGQAYPGSTIEVLRRSTVVGSYESVPLTSISVSEDGTFQISIENFLQAGYFFDLRVTDKDGQQSDLPLISQFVPSGSNVVVSNIVIPPTIDLDAAVISRGAEINVEGYAAPSSNVQVSIDGTMQGNTISSSTGFYVFATSTAGMALGNHSIQTMVVLPDGSESGFSLQKTFMVSALSFPKADLNSDGVVDVKDWSIFLFRWKSSDPVLRESVDFNGDGKVDISDFSIFMGLMNQNK